MKRVPSPSSAMIGDFPVTMKPGRPGLTKEQEKLLAEVDAMPKKRKPTGERSAAYRAAADRVAGRKVVGTPVTSGRPRPTATPDPYTAYRAEWSALPEAEQRRQGSIANFANRRINGLCDDQGLPTLPGRK